MKQVVIASGGKQYLVSEGQIIEIEKIAGKDGDKITLSEVLCVVDGENTVVGAPQVKDAAVKAVIVKQKRTPKVVVEKFHSKKRYHRQGGHRQEVTVIKIDKIG